MVEEGLGRERQMYHSVIKSNLVDTSTAETNRHGFRGGNDVPVSPKPRRLRSALPEFLKPLGCIKHSQLNADGRSGVHSMIAEKPTDGLESMCTGCSPSCFSGSPPGRTDNPLIHDVQFLHQMKLHH